MTATTTTIARAASRQLRTTSRMRTCRCMLSSASAAMPRSSSRSPIPALNVPLSEMAAGRQRQRSLPRQQQQQQPLVWPPLLEKNNGNEQRIFSSVAAMMTEPESIQSVPDTSGTSLDDADFLAEAGLDRDALLSLALQRATPLRLGDMYTYGTSRNLEQRLRNAQFLHRELPIRISQRMVDLLTLPHGLSEAVPVRQVVRIFIQYLKQLQEMPSPTTAEQEDAFTDMLQGFVLDRTSIPMWIARGVASWRDDGKCENLELERIQEMEDALYRFFTARVGLRFLIEHHVLSSPRETTRALLNVTHMFPPENNNSDTSSTANNNKTMNKGDEVVSGCIQSNIDLIHEARKVADLVMRQTTDFYGLAPSIEIVSGMNDEKVNNANAPNFTYVPHHLHYMLAELLKNASRATVQQYINEELHGRRNNTDNKTNNNAKAKLFPIRVIIVKGLEDVTIKIADKGGGIPRSLMAKIWKFGHHSMATKAASDDDTVDTYEPHEPTEFATDEVSGANIRGFGLPLARIYARYFGGELNLKSMEGYGVDAYLHLPRLGDSCENLPARVRVSPGGQDSMPSKHVRNFSTATTAAAAAVGAAANAPAGGQEIRRRDVTRWRPNALGPADTKTRHIMETLLDRAF